MKEETVMTGPAVGAVGWTVDVASAMSMGVDDVVCVWLTQGQARVMARLLGVGRSRSTGAVDVDGVGASVEVGEWLVETTGL